MVWKCLLILSFLIGAAQNRAPTPAEACYQELQMIDQKIEKLNQEKNVHLELSRKYQQDGDNWLYYSGSIQDGYRNWALADEERKKAVALQEEIDQLLLRKQRIYQYYPELQLP